MSRVSHDPLVAEQIRNKRFWQVPIAELQQTLEVGASGLTTADAAARLLRFGLNTLDGERHFSLFLKVLGRFRNPLVLILLAAATISGITGDISSFAIISSVVLLSVALDSVQEHRAEQAAQKLKVAVALNERVLRDGLEVTASATEIVPGDVVFLAAGDLVPADGRLLEAKDFFVNEALLTGESYPTEKHALAEGNPCFELGQVNNAAFMGSSVVSGSAKLLICLTGRATQVGEISGSLRHTPPPAALERGTYEFGLLIVRLTILLVLFVLLVNLLFHRPLLQSFLFALALAVGLTPELLPMITSVTLARGALRMAKERVIVKRLAAIHDLGSMDVLCTDKTGTLTEAKMKLARTLSLAGAESPLVLELARLNSHFQSGIHSPLDSAITESTTRDDSWIKVDEVPFDFERRRVSVLLEREGRRLLVVKGAPEDILKLSNRYMSPDEENVRAFDESTLNLANALFESLGESGFRVLGVATREVPLSQSQAVIADERDLIFAGFIAFTDPPKRTAGMAIAALKRSGVDLKILTGDNERVTQHLCVVLGIEVTGIVTGTELAGMSDEAIGARAEDTNLFCRLSPSQKNRVILALKRRGHVVGYLGDGINDAPSLHTADVGISVDGAVDVAKDAADMILLDHDLGVLERGIREGRRTFGNIMKYVMMGTSSNFGNMFSMAAASLFLPFLPMAPVQILLNNLLYDLSEVAIPLDDVDPEDTATPRHWDMRFVRNFMLVLGPLSSLFDFATFGVLLFAFHATQAVFQSGWFVESLATQILVIFIIRTRRNPFRSRPNKVLALTSLTVVGIGILLPYTWLGRWFGLVALPPRFLLVLGSLVLCYLVLAESVKRAFYRRQQISANGRAPILRPYDPFRSA